MKSLNYIFIVFSLIIVIFISGCTKPPMCGNSIVEKGETVVTCCEDTGCLGEQICQNHQCSEPVCGECQYLQDHKCLNYQCCNDNMCGSDETCQSNKCTKIVEPTCTECQYLANHKCMNYQCCNDNMCGSDETCQSNKCTKIVEPTCTKCQYLVNHKCVDYVCCKNEDCNNDETCNNHQCVKLNCGECQYLQNHTCQDYNCCSNADCEDGNVNTKDKCIKPKTMESVCNNSILKNINLNGSIIILKEDYSGQLIGKFSDKYDYIDHTQLINKFYSEYPDSVDFLVVFTNHYLRFSSSQYVSRDIEGIGVLSSNPYSNIAKRLKTINEINFFPGYKFGGVERGVEDSIIYGVIIHEITHYWCCFIDGLQLNLTGGHWANNLDLFNGDTRYVDLMGYNAWVITDSSKKCMNINDPSITPTLSDLTLYLMGLEPSEQVLPIKIHDFTRITDNAGITINAPNVYNEWGPACYDNTTFTDTRTVTIEDIQNINGIRIPSYESSQKDFTAVFVMVVSYNETPDQGFINYIESYKDALPDAWEKVTKNKSHIFYKDPK